MPKIYWPITASKPNREAEAYNKGYQDYQLGQPFDANPYLGDDMRSAWEKGWSAASIKSHQSIQP